MNSEEEPTTGFAGSARELQVGGSEYDTVLRKNATYIGSIALDAAGVEGDCWVG